MEIQTPIQTDPFGSILTPSGIQSILASEGPTVQAVVLRSNGTVEQVTYDSTPKKNMVTEILQAPPTIIGEWDQLQVILVRGRYDDEEKVPINPHKLRFPFNGMEIRGDIFLYRVNDQANAENFTKVEYEEFLSHSNEDGGKIWTDPFPTASDGLFQDTVAYDTLFANLQEKLREKFVEKHGRDPTAEELITLQQTIQALTGLNSSDDVDGLSDDSDYVPDETEDEDEDEDAIDEEENLPDEEDEDVEEIEDENKNWREKLTEAIDNVRSIAWADRQKVITKAATTYETESGEKVDVGIVKKAFDFLRDKLMPDEQLKTTQETNESEDTETENESDENQNENVDPNEAAAVITKNDQPETEVVEDEDEDVEVDEEEDEFETPLTEAEVQKEVREAFEHVRQLGAAHGREMAETIRQTFVEINGREPELDELTKIFGRMKAQLADEAGEELLETEVDEETTNKPSETTTKDFSTELEEKQLLVDQALTIVTPEMTKEAAAQFQQAVGKEPTQEELNQLLVSLATTPLINAEFGEDSEDEDYEPTAEDEKTVDEEFSVPLDPDELEIVFGSYPVTKDSTVLVPLPVNETLLEEAKNKFNKLNSRNPTETEVAELTKFITETKFTDAEFDSNDESDSDYDPSQDEEESADECPDLFNENIEEQQQQIEPNTTSTIICS